MYCQNCGNKLNTGEKYCQNCGNSITNHETKDDFIQIKNVLKAHKGISKWKWVIVIILSIIALSGSVWTAIGVFILGTIIINLISKN